jgi:DNA polymerase-3 subunit delta'
MTALSLEYPWLAPHWTQWLQLGQRLGHAYLLSGPKGIGLERFAAHAAQAALCLSPQLGDSGEAREACGVCKGCHLFSTAQHPDFYTLSCLEDKKEIGVDQVRGLMSKLNETSHQGGYKVIWIDEVERMNASAFNALLKTLEEPAPGTLFLLTTHQIGRLPATIKSRCQQIAFSTPSVADSTAWLQARLPQTDAALLKRALRVCWGSPLEAQAWIAEGKFAQDAQWNDNLKQLLAAHKTVSEVVKVWLKWPQPETVFDYFYLWSVSSVRSASYSKHSKHLVDESLLGQPLFSQPPLQVQNQLRFQQAVLQAKQAWLHNANKELVLETLCLEWLQIQHLDQPLQTAFASKLTKGLLP